MPADDVELSGHRDGADVGVGLPADPHLAGLLHIFRQGGPHRLVDRRHDVARKLQEPRAFGGQRDALGMTREQADPQFVFELLHRGRNRRLRDAEMDASMRDLARFGGRDEIADFLQ